jgi:CheY-like chemotaxis protein
MPASLIELPSLHGLSLLVVDDDNDALEVLHAFLQACGAVVFASPTVTGALAYVETARKLDAVIPDIAMPGIDGVEFTQKLRHDPKGKKVPTIALTGFYEDHAHTNLFDGFVKKPVNPDKLASTITSLVRRTERPHGPDPDCGR